MESKTYQILAVAQGLKLYAKTGMQPSRAWTPKAMLATAGRLTGKTYKRGQYVQAEADLRALL